MMWDGGGGGFFPLCPSVAILCAGGLGEERKRELKSYFQLNRDHRLSIADVDSKKGREKGKSGNLKRLAELEIPYYYVVLVRILFGERECDCIISAAVSHSAMFRTCFAH